VGVLHLTSCGQGDYCTKSTLTTCDGFNLNCPLAGQGHAYRIRKEHLGVSARAFTDHEGSDLTNGLIPGWICRMVGRGGRWGLVGGSSDWGGCPWGHILP
jgi:hypothetical protein